MRLSLRLLATAWVLGLTFVMMGITLAWPVLATGPRNSPVSSAAPNPHTPLQNHLPHKVYLPLVVSRWDGTAIPQDPATIAPPLDPTGATDLASATEFLYTGPNPIQTGVAAGTIQPQRVAVLRGRVLTRDGAPLAGVRLSILGHPELGQTLSRADGMFDLAVNGGGQLTLRYDKAGYLPAQRSIVAPWQDFAWMPDITLIPFDTQVTTIDLTAATPIQVARGSPVSDADGTRQATLLVPRGTTAEMILADGSTRPLTTMHVRATEYTVGDRGQQAMPAELPPNSGYTYALEYSVDEAVAAGAVDVRFNQPVFHYVENFIGFPVGSLVPTGYFDRARGIWVPSENGRVVQILSVTGGRADLDVDGDGAADSGDALTALGVTDAERDQLAALYQPGQSLWRVPITHFTPWDCNWPYGPPPDAEPPRQPPPEDHEREPDPCEQDGSIIECQNRVLGEVVKIIGTPFSLHYRSNRVPDHLARRTLVVPVSGSTLPAGVKRIEVEVSVAGRLLTTTLPAAPNQTAEIAWDGQDGYGRPQPNAQPATIRVGYVYNAVYYQPATFERSFARFSSIPISGLPARGEVLLWQRWTGQTRSLGVFDSRAAGFGGWTLDVHHTYHPERHLLALGDGRQRSAEARHETITTIAGTGEQGYAGDGGPATEAVLGFPQGIAVGPDGSVYIADTFNHRVRRIGPDGVITTIAGTGVAGFSGDGGPATQAQLSGPLRVTLGPDGSVYIIDFLNIRIRRVWPDGNITTIAGNGIQGFAGDGGPATAARLNNPSGLAVGQDGSLFIADTNSHRIRQVGTDGIIMTIAGDGVAGFNIDGGPAAQARFIFPRDIQVGPDGSVYVADTGNNRVRRIRPDGIIVTVAGTGEQGFSGDGGPATEARLTAPPAIAIGQDGDLFIVDQGGGVGLAIRRVSSEGIITSLTARTVRSWLRIQDIALSPSGAVLIAESSQIHRIASTLPSAVGIGILPIVEVDGTQIYEFDNRGRHQRTLHALTGAIRYSFAYDSANRLIAVTDGDGNTTTIERDGQAAAIVGPYGQRTTLDYDANGFLTRIAGPAGETTRLSYTAGGLLLSKTDPGGNLTEMQYDALGYLVSDENPVGESWTLARSLTSPRSYSVTLTSALGRTTVYGVETLIDGSKRRTTTFPDGISASELIGAGETIQLTTRSGMVATEQSAPHARWGMQAPIATSRTLETPARIRATVTRAQSVDLVDPHNPASVRILTDTVTVNGRADTSVYDVARRLVTQISPVGRQSTATMDEQGRLTEIRVPGLAPLTATYDSRGRLSQAGQADLLSRYTYDSLGRVAARTDAAGSQVQFAYDDAGRITRMTLPSGRTYRYTYDALGNRTSVTMPSGAVHQLGYTAAGQHNGYTPPSGAPYTKVYDRDGALAQLILPVRGTLAYIYDTAGRRTGISYPEATIGLVYDVTTGQTSGVTRTPSNGGTTQTIAFAYDGSLVTQTIWSGVTSGQYRYSYTSDFLLSRMDLTSGSDSLSTTLARDNDGRVTRLGPFNFTRGGPAGTASLITDNTVRVAYGYDEIGRVISRTHTVGAQRVYQVHLSYDSGGRIRQKVEVAAGSTVTRTYAYDEDGQLIEVQRGDVVVESYGYDLNGNRVSSDAAAAIYDNQDRLLERAGIGYQFDEDGYLTGRGADTFQYSARGELLEATVDGETVTYAYDGLNRRVARTDTAGTTQYLYGNPNDPFQITAVRDPTGVLSVYYYDENGLLFALQRGNSRFYIATDHLGSPRVVANSAGQSVKVLEYDSYGNLVDDRNPTFDLPFGFAGGLADSLTGLIRFGLRDYDPSAGRWTARDPLLFDGRQHNLYAYVGNDPISRRDVSGLQSSGYKQPFSWKVIDVIEKGKDLYDTVKEWWDRKEKLEEAIDDAQNINESLHDPNKSEGETGADLFDTFLKWCEELPLPFDIPIFEGGRKGLEKGREHIESYFDRQKREMCEQSGGQCQ